MKPINIEEESMKIIEKKLPFIKVTHFEKEVIKRIVHTTGDIHIVKHIVISKEAVHCGLEAIKLSRNIICDVNMVKAGINIKLLKSFGGIVKCFIRDRKVISFAKKNNLTRASVSMILKANELNKNIIAIGNAPTALFEVCNLIKKDKIKPALVIGVPVGFVKAKESKELLRILKVPYILIKGTRGGSAIAAAIVNALLKIANQNEKVNTSLS